jgi:hypothetical protein
MWSACTWIRPAGRGALGRREDPDNQAVDRTPITIAGTDNPMIRDSEDVFGGTERV